MLGIEFTTFQSRLPDNEVINYIILVLLNDNPYSSMMIYLYQIWIVTDDLTLKHPFLLIKKVSKRCHLRKKNSV